MLNSETMLLWKMHGTNLLDNLLREYLDQNWYSNVSPNSVSNALGTQNTGSGIFESIMRYYLFYTSTVIPYV